jgi:hypothetical protein
MRTAGMPPSACMSMAEIRDHVGRLSGGLISKFVDWRERKDKREMGSLAGDGGHVVVCGGAGVRTLVRSGAGFSLVKLAHPRTGAASRFLVVARPGGAGDAVLELQRVAPRAPCSWLVDQSVQRDGSMLLCSPIDAGLLLLPVLEQQRERLVPVAQLFGSSSEQRVLSRLVARDGGVLRRLCDVEEPLGEGELLVRLNSNKVEAWLKLKVERVAAALAARGVVGAVHARAAVASFNFGSNKATGEVGLPTSALASGAGAGASTAGAAAGGAAAAAAGAAGVDHDAAAGSATAAAAGAVAAPAAPVPAEAAAAAGAVPTPSARDLALALALVQDYLAPHWARRLHELYTEELEVAEAAQHAALERHLQPQQGHMSAPQRADEPGKVARENEERTAPKPKQAPAQLSLAQRQLQKVDKRGMSALTTFFTKKVKPNCGE